MLIFRLKLDPGVRRKCMRLRRLAWTKYKRVARPFPWISMSRGPTGPPYNFSFMDPPFSPFHVVSIGYYGPYVMCPFMVPIVN